MAIDSSRTHKHAGYDILKDKRLRSHSKKQLTQKIPELNKPKIQVKHLSKKLKAADTRSPSRNEFVNESRLVE